MFVSLSRCSMLVSRVHPEIVLSAVFCCVCSLFMFVLEVIGPHIVFAYSSSGRVMVLYVFESVSFDLPQCVVVSVLSMLSVFCDLLIVFCMCVLNVSLGSRVSPSIFGVLTVGSIVLFI